MSDETGRIRHRIGGGVSVVSGLLGLWASLQLPLGNSRLIGPGGIPLVLSLALVLLGAALFLRPPKLEETADDEEGGGLAGLLTVGGVIAMIAVFALVLSWLGFLLSATGLMYGLYAVGEGRILSLKALGWSVLTSVSAYLLFVTALGVRMPGGTLWGL